MSKRAREEAEIRECERNAELYRESIAIGIGQVLNIIAMCLGEKECDIHIPYDAVTSRDRDIATTLKALEEKK